MNQKENTASNNNAPTDALKARVLRDWKGVTWLPGYCYLAARQDGQDRAIVVVDGNFDRITHKAALLEAAEAGFRPSKVLVYCGTATYTGPGIEVTQFQDVGIGASDRKIRELPPGERVNEPTTPEWRPEYSRWRHGGWYVDNIRYPTGACGCVSNNYPDKKWRIACDDRRVNLGEDGDYTFPSRDAAAHAEYELVVRSSSTNQWN